MIFKHAVHVRGGFNSSYVFTSKELMESWIKTKIPYLIMVYKDISYSVIDLPGLQVGEECRVHGDGDEVYRITGLIPYNENRYGFILDSGFVEEVVKCYKVA